MAGGAPLRFYDTEEADQLDLHLQRGIAERQVAFRAQNERIFASADSALMAGPIPFVCECADLDCTEIVRLSHEQYDTITQRSRHFFNITGHEASSVAAGAERILTVVENLTVVVKTGIAGDFAAQAREGAPGVRWQA